MIINIDTERRIIQIMRDARAINDAEFERKHPRRDDGKFGAGVITVRGNELGGFNMTRDELRTAAVDYYKKNLAGTSVKHPELGDVHFSMGGYKKPISFSADERKLKLFPFLPQIIKQGTVIKTEEDRYNRLQVTEWCVLDCPVKLGNETIHVRVNLRKDNSGRLYYDHVINKTLGGTAYNDSQSKGFNNSIAPTNYIVNLFFDGEKPNENSH